MSTAFKCCADVKAFHDKFELFTPAVFTFLQPDLFQFRHKFLEEEFTEYREAYDQADLETAADSLIDLVYVTCGAALLHGISPTMFEYNDATTPKSHRKSELSAYVAYDPEAALLGEPQLLTVSQHAELCETLDLLIAQYPVVHEAEDSLGIQAVLLNIFRSCIEAAEDMKLGGIRWWLLWNEVQRANITKERAKRAEDSKRGSTWDVIKPAGWTPPDIQGKLRQISQELLNV